MDAVGSEQAALVGLSEGGAIAALFAATYPARARCIIAIGSGATSWLPTDEFLSRALTYVDEAWGTGGSAVMFAPTVSTDPAKVAWFARWEQLSGSPGSIKAMMRMNREFDVRSALPLVTAPTLVIHRTGDMTYTVEQGRALADAIPGARFVELPGRDHAPWFEDADTIGDLVEELVTGDVRPADVERVLATTLFTDIVDSTAMATKLGDRRWKELLDDYDAAVAKELERVQGRLVKTTGDGTLATFDSPGRAIRCARATRDAAGSLGLQLRAGLHAGEIELRGDDVSGLAVVIAQQVSARAQAGEILASSTVKDLVAGSGTRFEPRGEHELQGVDAPWAIYAVAG
jgi:class 3 adenylate cyclase